jgi:hypothetical protein
MNTAQLTSAIKQLLNSASGFLVAHGHASTASFLNKESLAGYIALAIIWAYTHFIQHTDEKEATPTPLPPSKGGGTLPPLAVFALLGLGVSLLFCSCAKDSHRLELGGAYAPATPMVTTNNVGDVATNMVPVRPADFKLYAADASFDLAYSSLDTAFKIERDNRALLWKVSPDIKHSLDAIRPKAVEAVKAYSLARTVYIANPVPDNENVLNTAIASIKTLADAALAVTSQLTISNQ